MYKRKIMLHIREHGQEYTWTADYEQSSIMPMGHDIAHSVKSALLKARKLYRSKGINPGKMVFLAIDEDGHGYWYGTDKAERIDKSRPRC